MSESKSLNVCNIDLGKIASEIDSRAGFALVNWEGHIDAALKAVRELKPEIITALKQLQAELGRNRDSLGQDGPTDVIWILSLLLIIRTLGILVSKSTDKQRNEENKKEHSKLVERYVECINDIIHKKDECAALFPHC